MQMKNISILTLFLFGANILVAQRETIKSLSLDDAIQLAKKNRTEFLLAGKDASIAKEALSEQQHNYFPKLNFNADIRYNAILATSIVPNFANLASGETQAVKFGQPWQSSAGLTLTQSLLNPTLKPGVESKNVSVQLAENARIKSEIQLVETISTGYYQVLLNQVAVSFSEASYNRQLGFYNQIAGRQKQGRALLTDANTAFINKENARLSVQQSLQNLLLSKQFLLLQIGLDSAGAQKLELTNKLLNFSLENSTSMVDSTIYKQRIEWKETELNALQAFYNEKKESKAIIPTINLVGYYGALGFSKDAGNTFNFSNNWFTTSYIGLQISTPILDFGRTNRVATQRIYREKAFLQQAQTKKQISYEIAQASLQRKQAVETIDVRKQNLELAKTNKETIVKRYEEGRGLVTDVLDAESLLRQAEQDLLQSIFTYLNADLAYRKAVGNIGGGR
jgi:outer membrane protein